MNRTTACVVVLVVTTALTAKTVPAAEPPFLKNPYIQNVTKTSAVVMWETKEPVEYRLTWSTGGKEVGGKRGRIEEDDQYKLKVAEVRIEGLKPNTIYKYSVEIGGKRAGGTFQTFPDREIPFRFIVYSDTQDTFKGAPERHRKFARLFAKKNPRLIIHSGDLLDVGSRYKAWNTAHFGPLEGLAENVPIYPALGNHEYNNGGNAFAARWYYKFHSLPGNEQWYSFDFSNVHFICLDSEVYQLEALKGQAPEQLRWLEADLKASKARWKVVYFHHLVYNSGVFGGMVPLRRKWAPLFEKHGVNVVFNGHNHYYLRTMPIKNGKRNPGGVTYFITGVSDGYGCTDGYHVTCASPKASYAVVDVDKDTMRIVIRGAEDNEMDRLVLAKSDKYLREAETLAGSLDAQTRLRAVKDLAALNDNTSGEALKRLAQDKDPGIAAAALRALVQTGQLSTDELLRALRNPGLSRNLPKGWGSVSPSQLAQNRLYERPAKEQMAVAKELLGDEDHQTCTQMKRLGIRLLTNVASTEALERLDKLAEAPSHQIRAETARCLGRIFDPYGDPLGMDMGLPSFLSERLAEFPGRVASPEKVFAMLIRLLDDKNADVRDVALKSFWNMAGHYQFLHESGAGCVERLIKLTAHTNSKLRCKSIRLLGRARPSRKIDALLVKLLDDGDAMVSMHAVIPLLELADWRDRLVREATPGLVRNLGRYHWWASQDAMRLLRRFTGKKFRRKAEWQAWHKSGAK